MSIFSVNIANFQSHEKTRLLLHPRINALVGDSDCGKSAVMRAILWCITNDPQGTAHLSNWIKDDKGTVKGRCLVRLDSEGGVVTRERSQAYNGYHLDTEDDGSPVECSRDFEALRTDVPKEIAETLNIGAVNIQQQMDPPFLISATPGEAARYVNSLVDLQVIDEALATVNGMHRDTVSELKYAIGARDKCADKLSALEWVQRLQELATDAAKMEGDLRVLESKEQRLRDELEQWETANRRNGSLAAALDRIDGTLESLDDLSRRLDRAIMTSNRLGQSFREYHAEKRNAAGLDKLRRAGSLLEEVSRTGSELDRLENMLKRYATDRADYVAARRVAAIDVDTLDAILAKLSRTRDEIDRGNRIIEGNRLREYMDLAKFAHLDFEPIDGKLVRLSRVASALSGCRGTLEALTSGLSGYEKAREALDNTSSALGSALVSLEGKVCPCCGRPMHTCEM